MAEWDRYRRTNCGISTTVLRNFQRTQRKEILSCWWKCKSTSFSVTESVLTIRQYAGMFIPCKYYPRFMRLCWYKWRHCELHLWEYDKINTRPRFARYLDEWSLVFLDAWLVVTLIRGLNTAVLGWTTVQIEIPAVGFVHKYENVFAFKSVILQFSQLIALKLYTVKHSSHI